MKSFQIAIKEFLFRWRSSMMMVLVVASITGLVSFYIVNRSGFTKEIKRNVRDIGSNIVILPTEVDQLAYHRQGGFTEQTMPEQVVTQLIHFKASLNHLIPMLEQKAMVAYSGRQEKVRIVGISASIPMPGRPKAPMQRAVKEDRVQIGSALAEALAVDVENQATINIAGVDMMIERVNQSTGTWRDSAVFMDLHTSQEIFDLPGQISRVEAIECTSEKCEALGVTPNVVLSNELANITEKAKVLRRESIANARTRVRNMSDENLKLLTNTMWIFLVVSTILLATWNSVQRKSEIGLYRAIGFTRARILGIFLWRAILLSMCGAIIGVIFGSCLSLWNANAVFSITGPKATIDLLGMSYIAVIAVTLTGLATLIPATIAASRHPAEIIGRDGA